MIRLARSLLGDTALWKWLRERESFRAALGFEATLWTRKVADEAVRALVRPLGPERLSVLEVSGDVWRDFGFARRITTNYPGFDLTRDVLGERFDLVILEHVLEHVSDPLAALRNALAMTRPRGHLLIVTPFLYKIHRCPGDHSRWTPEGLAALLRRAGADPDGIQVDAWGNRACLRATLAHEYILFNRYLHSLRNEPEYPLVVWALARKPGEVA